MQTKQKMCTGIKKFQLNKKVPIDKKVPIEQKSFKSQWNKKQKCPYGINNIPIKFIHS